VKALLERVGICWHMLASVSAAAVECTSEASCLLPRLMAVGRLAVPRNASLLIAALVPMRLAYLAGGTTGIHRVLLPLPTLTLRFRFKLRSTLPATRYWMLPLQLAAPTNMP
jgi:hypothetical protein